MKTLKELAKLTGFSPATLSRVLTQNKNVNSETRRKVEAALVDLHYQPVRTGRRKSARKTVMVIAAESASLFHTKLYPPPR